MARKDYKLLSGGVTTLFVVLLCFPGTTVQAGFQAQEVTFTISGSVGVSGVTMKGLPGAPVVSDDNGYYSATVKFNWSGTVTPTKDGYTFKPASKTYTKVASNLNNEDYFGTLATYTISGTTGMVGVEMNGLPGNPVTGSDGTYRATVDYDWSGTVTPTKEGYSFTPASRQYTGVRKDEIQNYTAAEITFVISGSVGAPGVVMRGLPNNPVSDKDGIYSATVKFGFSGMVTPTKDGYEFNPPSMQYTDVISAQTNQDYFGKPLTYTISGTAGLAGVELKGLPGNPVTDDSGYYTATVEHGWDGTVTPAKDGYTFEPASMTYTNVTSERSGQSYIPNVITLTISGRTGLPGVEMNGLPGNPITGSDGTYKATVDYSFSGTVIPIKEGYKFTPDQMAYSLLTRDQMNQNYSASEITFTISGNVEVAGAVMDGLPNKPASGKDGTYSAVVKYGFTGEVRPTREGYDFDPPSRSYTDLIGPETNQDYTATLLKRSLAGRIISDKGQPVEDVSVIADSGGGTGITNGNGEYELEVDYGWRGTVTPVKEGHTFRPPNKTYGAVTRDQTNQSYTAMLKMYTISGAVIIGTTPIEGVLITASNGGGSDTTDSSGKYSVRVPFGWTGEISPTKAGFVFDPPSEAYANVTSDYKDGRPVLPQPTEPVPTTPTAARPPTAAAAAREPVPTTPIPTEPVPTEPVPTEPARPTEAEAPRTPLERDIARIQDQLAELLERQAAEETGVPTLGPSEPGEPLITNTFVDNDLVLEVLPNIASQAGIPIVPEETVAGIVTCTLQDVPLDTALEIVLAGTPYVVTKTPYYYLVAPGTIESAMFPVVSVTRRVRLNHITAERAVGLLSPAFRNYVQAESVRPGTPPGPATDTYTVLVTAPPALADRIVADLEMLDKLPKHVMLDARIVVMERGDLLNLGVNWNWPNIQAGVFGSNHRGGGDPLLEFGGKWPWGIQIGYSPDATFTNSLELALNLLAQNEEATVLAKPQVLAQDGKEARIQVMTEEYFFMTEPETTFFYSRAELEKIESGTSLNIVPRIGDDNDITLIMSVEVSDSVPRGRESDLPVVTRRTASNTVRIKDGGTVAVAGLTENRTRVSNRRVPGLSNLPVLGPLFKSTADVTNTREVAVFVTARIVPEHSQAAQFSDSATIQAPAEPVGEDFRASLRESLSRSRSIR